MSELAAAGVSPAPREELLPWQHVVVSAQRR
jgi:hypothetical protein